eukprot:gb/GECH01002802.1/.p1 GENE.gb/GECH01002802.1/~~gb/GECH01002802.1/.p1  ORF type:complete len:111 (+),score=9.21 gb/GECH01002802.1/:1-333(+)
MIVAPRVVLGTAQHRADVKILYRRALKNLNDYIFHTDIYNEACSEIRREFDMFSKETDPAKVDFLMQRASKYIYKKHPEPNINPYHKGGIAWARNEPMSLDLVKKHSVLS